MEQITYISPKPKRFSWKLREVWRYRDLVLLLTRKNFTVTYKQTVLGPAWIVIPPILTSIIYVILFNRVVHIGTDGLPPLLFYMCNNAIWGFFSSTVGKTATTFVANAAVFGKVYFPRLTVPISDVLVNIIKLGIQMVVVLVLLVYFVWRGELHPNWISWLFLPLIIVWIGLLGMSVGIMISSVTTKYRDLSILVSFGIQLWMYGTPVVYPLSQLSPGVLRTLVLLNPASAPVECFRQALLGGNSTVPLWSIVLSLVLTAGLFLLSSAVFNRVEKTFMDTV